MGTQKAKRHTHKYRLVPMNASKKVWACALPDCNHYMPPNMERMIEGKASVCWDCGNETIMSVERMKFAIAENDGLMLCEQCINKRQGFAFTDDDESMNEVLKKMGNN